MTETAAKVRTCSRFAGEGSPGRGGMPESRLDRVDRYQAALLGCVSAVDTDHRGIGRRAETSPTSRECCATPRP